MKDFHLPFEINFKTIIRGHHIYKSIWTSSIGQVLLSQTDEWKEALDYDKYAAGISKRQEEDISKLSLVGHIPVELSKLLYQFLKADTGHCIYVEVIGETKTGGWTCGTSKILRPHKMLSNSKSPRWTIVKNEKTVLNFGV